VSPVLVAGVSITTEADEPWRTPASLITNPADQTNIKQIEPISAGYGSDASSFAIRANPSMIALPRNVKEPFTPKG
jgi:hypothetical protein